MYSDDVLKHNYVYVLFKQQDITNTDAQNSLKKYTVHYAASKKFQCWLYLNLKALNVQMMLLKVISETLRIITVEMIA